MQQQTQHVLENAVLESSIKSWPAGTISLSGMVEVAI